jgi:myosin heavy subunit
MRDRLETLRKEAESSLRALYALRQFRTLLTDQKSVNELNKNVYFWQLFESALKIKLFIGVRRLYDSTGNAFTLQSFIKGCIDHIDQFSPSALRKRKMESSANAHEWVDCYMKDVHEATAEDFKNLARLVKDNSKRMKGVYTDIASKVYAHAIHTDARELFKLSQGTDFNELESALTSIWHVYQQVWQMYENGREPDLNVGKYPYINEVVESVNRQIITK